MCGRGRGEQNQEMGGRGEGDNAAARRGEEGDYGDKYILHVGEGRVGGGGDGRASSTRHCGRRSKSRSSPLTFLQAQHNGRMNGKGRGGGKGGRGTQNKALWKTPV